MSPSPHSLGLGTLRPPTPPHGWQPYLPHGGIQATNVLGQGVCVPCAMSIAVPTPRPPLAIPISTPPVHGGGARLGPCGVGEHQLVQCRGNPGELHRCGIHPLARHTTKRPSRLSIPVRLCPAPHVYPIALASAPALNPLPARAFPPAHPSLVLIFGGEAGSPTTTYPGRHSNRRPSPPPPAPGHIGSHLRARLATHTHRGLPPPQWGGLEFCRCQARACLLISRPKGCWPRL